jgi:HD-GYP domain-containing protein (c-di-GMP phosphodiesterase class II)
VKPRKSPPTQGLQIRRHGETLESVDSKALALHLLATGDVELAEGVLNAGERITLVPDSSATPATEIYYLLSGRLINVGERNTSVPLGPGDCLITRDLMQEAIFSALEEVRFLYFTSRPFFQEISGKLQELMRLAVEVEVKDGYTAEHCTRLMQLSFTIGQEVGLDSHRLRLLSRGAFLHDVGKAKVPQEILQKPASLTTEEWTVIKLHPTFGREMLEPTFIREAGPIVEQHHERLDGSGYPYGLSKDEILPESYIVAIADAYDAMTTDRVYRKALPAAEAEAELRRYAGIHYPRELIDAFLSAIGRSEVNP